MFRKLVTKCYAMLFVLLFSSKIVIHVDVCECVCIYIRVTLNQTLSDMLGCRKFVFL